MEKFKYAIFTIPEKIELMDELIMYFTMAGDIENVEKFTYYRDFIINRGELDGKQR